MNFTSASPPALAGRFAFTKAAAAALLLALSSAGAMAAASGSYSISGFNYSVSNGSALTFDTASFQQSVTTEAFEAGGLLGNQIANASSVAVNNTTYSATTANSSATTTASTNQRFSGSASATPSLLGGTFGQPNRSVSLYNQLGEFTLDTPGQVTFQVSYVLDAIAATGNAIDYYGESSLSFSAGVYGGAPAQTLSESLFSADEGGFGLSGGTFSLTVDVGANQTGYFSLAGTAGAYAPSAMQVSAIPEPSEYAMMLMGLVGVGAWVRRARSRASKA